MTTDRATPVACGAVGDVDHDAGTGADREPYLASRLQGFGTTIFAEMSALAVRTGAINLGQGFPDADGPAEVAEAAIAAIRDGQNQYPPGPGIPDLRAAIVEHQARFWGIDLDPDAEVLVTAGATEAIAAALLALCEPGDEVLTFEPFYDSYRAAASMAGATLSVVTLEPPADGDGPYAFDLDALGEAVSPRTRLVLLNSPHNPTGKVFDRRRARGDRPALRGPRPARGDRRGVRAPGLRRRARPDLDAAGHGGPDADDLLGGQDVLVHGLEGRLGHGTGAARDRGAHRQAVPHLRERRPVPARRRRRPPAGRRLLRHLRDDLARKRDVLCDGLARAGLRTIRPDGTYFVTVDLTSVGESDGAAFCRSLPDRCGVVAVPNSVFYLDPARGRHLVRFAFCKQESVLEEAASRLATLSG